MSTISPTEMHLEPSAVHILLVEDSPSDAAMTMHALRAGRIANTLHHVGDGEEAMRFLRKEGDCHDLPRPDLIILDLNLPRMDGREVLAAVKADESLKSIPVVVLTTSASESDILSVYQLQANSYVTKPVDVDEFLRAIRGIEDFWLSLVRLPTAPRGLDRHAAAPESR